MEEASSTTTTNIHLCSIVERIQNLFITQTRNKPKAFKKTLNMNRLLAVLAIALVSKPASSFAPQCNFATRSSMSTSGLFSTTADEQSIPTKLPSDVGMDYVPLATMLASGEFQEADQVCFFLFSTCKK